MKLWNLIVAFFTRKKDPKPASPVVVQPKPPIAEVPTPEEVENFPSTGLNLKVDTENNGNPGNPDWSYLAYTAKIDNDKRGEVFAIAKKQVDSWHRYKELEKITSVPAGVIADIHQKECSLDFGKCLHNGQAIIGKNKKTTWVPEDRGPFATFEESAIDALEMKRAIFPTSKNWNKYYDEPGWTTVNILKFHQRYNGMGHQNKGLEYTPYDWAYTNHHDETGNFYADRKYSATHKITSPGTMATMLARSEMGFI